MSSYTYVFLILIYRSYTFMKALYDFHVKFQILEDACSGVASQTIYSRYANFKVLSLFISLQIDRFHSQ